MHVTGFDDTERPVLGRDALAGPPLTHSGPMSATYQVCMQGVRIQHTAMATDTGSTHNSVPKCWSSTHYSNVPRLDVCCCCWLPGMGNRRESLGIGIKQYQEAYP